jgi:hypothetical protein
MQLNLVAKRINATFSKTFNPEYYWKIKRYVIGYVKRI